MKKFRLDPDNEDFFYAFMRVKLEKKFHVIAWEPIDYGCQLRLKNGTIVNLYRTMNYSLGGHGTGMVIGLMKSLVEEFRWVLKTDAQNEQLAKRIFNT